MQTLHHRISKLWAAALNLESSARSVLDFLPDAEKVYLEHELDKFVKIITKLKSE